MRPIKSKEEELAALGGHGMHGDAGKHALAALRTIQPVGVLVCMNPCARHPAHGKLLHSTNAVIPVRAVKRLKFIGDPACDLVLVRDRLKRLHLANDLMLQHGGLTTNYCSCT